MCSFICLGTARRCFVSQHVAMCSVMPVCVSVCVHVHVQVCVLAQEISISSLMETADGGTNKMRKRRANPHSRGPVRMDDEADMK